MINDFKAGDVVQLKSGGPPMTVTDVSELGVQCQWFMRLDEGHWIGDPESQTFPATALKMAEEEEAGMN